MGVKGLWRLLHPVARPIKLETLANRRLAVDASIWLHQFLRGMRDPDGNAIANAHILGFYRRICKLLYYNIKPVFVYDGGTPNLKRLTLAERRRRKRNDAQSLKRTAEKLLATQLRLRELEKKRLAKKEKEAAKAASAAGVEIVHDSTDNPKYFDELRGLAQAEATANEKAALMRSVTGGNQGKDRYVLPPMETDFETLARMRQHDLRFGVRPEDLEQDDIQKFIEDLKRDGGLANIDSDVFRALPSELQYEILSDIRLRSRVTSYERVQEMVRLSNTPMDFSKLQVLGVVRRNNVTQKLLTVNQAVNKLEEAEATTAKPGRIASQRNREYLLVKNEEGGWVLGGRATAGTTKDKPLNLDSDEETPVKSEPLSQVHEVSGEDDDDDDVEFEEVKVRSKRTLPAVPTKDHLEHQNSLVDDFEAYVDENESIEQVMAKFAELEEQGGEAALMATSQRRRETTPTTTAAADIENANRPGGTPIGTPRKTQLMVDMDDVESAASPFSHGSLDFGDLDDTLDDLSMVMVPNHDSPKNRTHQQQQQQQQHGIVISDTLGITPKAPRHHHTTRALSATEEDQLDQAGFLTYWTAYMPTSFKERHPTHDFMVREAIYEWDDEQLDLEKHSAERKLEKMSVNDVVGVECQQFWAEFLISLDRWRQAGEGRARAPLQDVEDDGGNGELAVRQVARAPTPPRQAPAEERMGGTGGKEQPLAPAIVAPSQQQQHQPIVDIGTLDFGSSVFKRARVKEQADALTPIGAVSVAPPVAASGMSTDSGVGSLAGSPELSQAATTTIDLETGDVKEEDLVMHDVGIIDQMKEEEEEKEEKKKEEEEEEEEQKEEDGLAAGMEDEEEHDGLDEAHAVDLVNEEQDFTKLFPDMASLPGVTVMPKSEQDMAPAEETVGGQKTEQQQRQELSHEQREEEERKETRRLQEELKSLQEQKRRHNRDADELTEQMVGETQQLLRLFGIPYIVAPMEAEAQCADLQQRGVVEGIVTEDSDVFLFGGQRVFKNMFREERYVECYVMREVERDLGITRDRLIQLAQLLGSDYASGIKGVGAITAMEILRLFPSLEKFARWWRGSQGASAEDEDDEEDSPKDEVALDKLAKFCQKLHVPNGFPSSEVSEAYLHPMVDDNDEGRFEWGIPDLDGLRDFLRQNLAWDRGEVDRVLLPIIRQMSRVSMEGSQATLDSFFDYSVGMGAFQGHNNSSNGNHQQQGRRHLQMSARLRKVVRGLVGERDDGDGVQEDGQPSEVDKPQEKGGAGKKRSLASMSGKGGRAKKTTANGKRATVGRGVGVANEGGDDDDEEMDGPTSGADDKPSLRGGALGDGVETVEGTASQKRRRKTGLTAGEGIKGRKPTVVGRKPKDRAPAGVQAAKRNLASKGVEAKLAERRRLLAEAESRQSPKEAEVVVVAGVESPRLQIGKRPLAPEDYSTASDSSSGEDQDFVQDHWDRLDGSLQSAAAAPQPKRPSAKKAAPGRRSTARPRSKTAK